MVNCRTCGAGPRAMTPATGVKLDCVRPFAKTLSSGAKAPEPLRFRTRFVPRAEEFDIDVVLGKLTDKFEKAENKPVVIGYGVAALAAFFVTEWLIHLPVLDVLLGFPVQLVGVLVAPVLVLRYVVDKEDWYADAEGIVEKIAGLLPGLKE